jgi:hypothetical protein
VIAPFGAVRVRIASADLPRWVFNIAGLSGIRRSLRRESCWHSKLSRRSAKERDTREAEVAVIDTDELILQAHKRAELRKMLVGLGLEPPDVPALKAVLSQCPDVDLACTALTMIPRPSWVLDLVEPQRVDTPGVKPG